MGEGFFCDFSLRVKTVECDTWPPSPKKRLLQNYTSNFNCYGGCNFKFIFPYIFAYKEGGGGVENSPPLSPIS